MGAQRSKANPAMHCCIPVKDVKQAAVWYVKYMGCEYGDTITERHAQLKLSGGPDITLIGVDECFQLKQDGQVIPMMDFLCEDVQELHEYFEYSGIRVGAIVDQGRSGKSFKLLDPDGNHLIVWQTE
ncbi:VOC family protein [Paenibacillus harenae]|uniref:VOC family protein n=1 Tax=Paenibacillus harenae TaxID=306543 RepID=UPI00279027BE|nr:VOC family protein [Paenibacillus harenae]MDQ0062081.1 catechol 2,3-dioxygenase-like lactoylglutathione lyase family enzyme [Paenibacillus harenae]